MPILLYQSEPTPDTVVREFLNSTDAENNTLRKAILNREEAKDRVISDYTKNRLKGEWKLFCIVDDESDIADMTNEVTKEDIKGQVPEAKLTQIRQLYGSRIR